MWSQSPSVSKTGFDSLSLSSRRCSASSPRFRAFSSNNIGHDAESSRERLGAPFFLHILVFAQRSGNGRCQKRWGSSKAYVYVGKIHDYSILKVEFPPESDWFEDLEVRLDLGYQGFDKEYKCKKLFIPHKKSKKSELTDNQKAENKNISSERIKVEHSRGGMKRYRILSERLRIHDFDLYDDILNVCAGLLNFYLYPN